MSRNSKKIVFDVILNIIATALPLIALQLLIFPFIEKRIGEENYGSILTIVSLLTIVCNSLGNSLNNIRLISRNKYDELGEKGDFNIILMIAMLISAVSVGIGILRYPISKVDFILLVLLALLWTFREYAIVSFRIVLNYKAIVMNNLIMITGYAIGLLLFILFGYWEFVYLVGIVFSIIYIIVHSKILLEPFAKTRLLTKTCIDCALLVIASLMLNLLNYADRMLIYPLIGGVAVTVYYASSLFGKIVSSAVSPINSVVLSYISKRDKVRKREMLLIILCSLAVAIVGYGICRLIAFPALSMLYPSVAEDAMKYVPITSAVAMISMISSVISPFVLKFCKMGWQIFINGTVVIIYIVLSIVLNRYMGLMGFCYGVLISNVVKLGIMIILGLSVSQKEISE